MLNVKESAIKNIVVAADFSPCSDNAFVVAVELGRSLGAEITSVFVKNLDDLALAIRKELHANLRNKKSLAKETKAFIESGFQHLQTKYGQGYEKIRYVTLTGQPWSQILKVARQEKAGLIVTGTRSRSPLKKLVLGSTAARLIEHSTCPVITVGENYRPYA
jgi:nucleotide-binding universal stress UspA family protein